MDNTLGAEFRELRRFKKISIIELTDNENIISASQLSKFERGVNDLPAKKLFTLLNRMDVTVDEFYAVVDGAEPYATFLYHINDIRTLYNANDSTKLAHLQLAHFKHWKKSGITAYRHLAIIADVYVKNLQDDNTSSPETTHLVKQLEKMQDGFTKYELMLIETIIVQLPTAKALQIGNLVLNRRSKFAELKTNDSVAKGILVNLVITLIERQEYESAKEILIDAKKYNPSSADFYVPTLFLFLEGLLLIAEKKTKQGAKLAQQAITVMQLVGTKDQASAYTKYLTDFLEAKTL